METERERVYNFYNHMEKGRVSGQITYIQHKVSYIYI